MADDLVSQGVEPRPSATAILVRERDAQVEVLTICRAQSLRVLPGFTVFPGGVVDEVDRQVARRWMDQGTITVGCSDFVVTTAFSAAVREVIEEIGVWLINAPLADDVVTQSIRAGDAAAYLAATETVTVRGRTRYFGRRITPTQIRYRFDTLYFLMEFRGDASFALAEAEVESASWASPKDVLKRYAQGQCQLAPPTIDALEAVASYATINALFASGRMPAQSENAVRVAQFAEELRKREGHG